MGVLGLATYLKENASLVSRPIKFDSVLATKEEERTPTALIVDAWGLIYELLSHTPWPYGGEYLEFADLLRRTVTGWRAVGLEPVFVYDGPTPPIKFSTELQRQQSLILPISLFHHMSPSSRLSRSSWSSQLILPPLFYSTAVDVGLALGVESIWAESEADLRCAYEAGKRNGYITALDSDFTIYGAQGRGAGKGYIPLNQMKWDWVELEQGEEEEQEQEQEKKADAELVVIPDEDGNGGDDQFFEVVRSKTHKKNERNRNNANTGRYERKGRWNNRKPSALPPSVPAVSFLTSLSAIIYTPELLAAELGLPLNILPLFAALVGNDYFKYGQAFHHRSATSAQKVDRVSTVLRECLSPKAKKSLSSSTNSRSGTATPIETSGDEALLLLSNATNALLLHPRTEQEMEPILHALIDSALSYTIPRDLADFPLSPSTFSPAVSSSSGEDVFALYVDAARTGRFAPKLAGVVRDGRYLGRLFIEDTTRASVGKRAGEGIREACWAVLDQGVGIGFKQEEEEEDEEAEEEDTKTESDKVDVAAEEGDEEGDPTAEAQREELDAILEANAAADDSNTEDPSPAEQESTEEQSVPLNTRCVQTYLRSGTIFHPTLVPISSLIDLVDASAFKSDLDFKTTPIVLQPQSVRIQAYMHLLGSPSISIRDELKPMVLAIRWIARCLAEEPSKPGVNYHSRRAEIKALIFTAVRSFHSWSRWQRQLGSQQGSSPTSTTTDRPPAEEVSLLEDLPVGELTNRAIHVTSYYLHALHDSDLLAQTLLLSGTVLPGPHVFYNGKLAHKSLSDWTADRAYRPSFGSDEEEKDYESCVEDVLGSEVKDNTPVESEDKVDDRSSRKKDKKKAKREKAATATSGGGESDKKKSGKQAGGLGGMFDLLGEMDC